MQSKYIVFLEVIALIGCYAFFSGQHEEHLNRLQDTLDTIQRSVEASQAALQKLQGIREEIASARVETDRKMLEAPDGDMCYQYYDRLLREDAERRASGGTSADGTHVPVH